MKSVNKTNLPGIKMLTANTFLLKPFGYAFCIGTYIIPESLLKYLFEAW